MRRLCQGIFAQKHRTHKRNQTERVEHKLRKLPKRENSLQKIIRRNFYSAHCAKIPSDNEYIRGEVPLIGLYGYLFEYIQGIFAAVCCFGYGAKVSAVVGNIKGAQVFKGAVVIDS